jgi:ubiquinol-cytochrome c reductase cytochrome c1 subunit
MGKFTMSLTYTAPKTFALTALALVFLVTPGYAGDAAGKPEQAAPTEAPTEKAPADEATGQPGASATGQNVTEKSAPAVESGPATAHSQGANVPGHAMPVLDWSFNGPFGTYDKASLQRGFLVYKQVCSACHGLKKIYYRNLEGLGYSEAQVKTIAAEYTAMDGPNDEGEMFERPARPSDKFKLPYENDKAAAYANNGALPPDLSLITKARHGGADYVYGVLTGYTDAPAGFALASGQHYNKVKDGNIIAMAPPLSDGLVAYEDGSPQTLDQYAKDVSQFLTWAAEPEMEARKQMGAKVIIFLAIFALIMYAAKRRVWEKLH